MNDVALPKAFLSRPIAHRGLHDLSKGSAENSRAAIKAAIAHGFGIEIDLQLAADGAAMVFHDYALDRLTGETGSLKERTRSELSRVRLRGTDETVPDLPEVLALVAGRVPLLIELKDQDGALGENIGALEAAVTEDLAGYKGPVAVMSFNPHSTAAMMALAPDLPRGLVTDSFTKGDWTPQPQRADALDRIEDFDRVGACFISHNRRFLDMPAVADLKARDVPILCWTVRSPAEEAAARRVADNITFEGYFPDASA